jgi:hypothetical protein
MLETVFSVRSVQGGSKEELSWEGLVEFRDASLPGYELGSRGIELSQILKLAVAAENRTGRVLSWQNEGKKEIRLCKKTSCVIWSYSETVMNPKNAVFCDVAHIQENCILHSHRRENLKSYICYESVVRKRLMESVIDWEP